MTQGELCDALINFFTTQLHAVEIQPDPPFSPDSNLPDLGGGRCELFQGQDQVGYYTVLQAPNEPDPTEGMRGYEKKPDLGDAVWVYDMRADERNPSNRVRFATRVNSWNAVLVIRDTEIRTANGPLHLTDADKVESVRFLTELTTKFALHR
ncbi:hypothetical protein ABZW96_26530 [Nocardia sp. NPDC004168]|uniref:hypothetical protein n=1 Tax=unclassified Nocardia TaxID=2637762 RepID=UPI0033B6A8E3